jgi:hypothetical protein
MMVDIRFMLDVIMKKWQFTSQERWNRKLLEAHQKRMLHILRQHAHEHSPFYQRFHAGLFDAPLDQLPVLTKAQMMEQFDSLITNRAVHLADIKRYIQDQKRSRYFLGRYVINATSGVLPLLVVDNSFSAFQRGKSGLGQPPSFWRTNILFSLVYYFWVICALAHKSANYGFLMSKNQ